MLCRAHPQKRRQTTNVVLVVANTLMFLLSATVRHLTVPTICPILTPRLQHLILDIVAAHEGFLHSTKAIEAAKFMLYVSQTLIGDGFLVRTLPPTFVAVHLPPRDQIYRLYRVFNSSWTAVLLPTFLLWADAGAPDPPISLP